MAHTRIAQTLALLCFGAYTATAAPIVSCTGDCDQLHISYGVNGNTAFLSAGAEVEPPDGFINFTVTLSLYTDGPLRYGLADVHMGAGAFGGIAGGGVSAENFQVTCPTFYSELGCQRNGLLPIELGRSFNFVVQGSALAGLHSSSSIGGYASFSIFEDFAEQHPVNVYETPEPPSLFLTLLGASLLGVFARGAGRRRVACT
jgi:hypothetical protein